MASHRRAPLFVAAIGYRQSLHEKAMRGRIVIPRLSENEIERSMNFARTAFGARHALALLSLLPLRFLQLLPDLVFLVANVL
jgi:hypothetical protein